MKTPIARVTSIALIVILTFTLVNGWGESDRASRRSRSQERYDYDRVET